MSVVHLPPYVVSFNATALSEGVDWGLSAYNVPPLWKSTRGEGVTVAVVDTGVAKHFALEVADSRNFSGDSEVDDTVGHGTFCAGVLAARKGQAKGIAPGCSLISLKVLGHSGSGNPASVARAVEYASEIQADIISMSLGCSRPDAQMHDAIKRATAQGIIIVCAAGNDGGAVDYPAAFAETIAVGAVDRSGQACEFSSRGREIVCAAPGQGVTSTWLADGYATLSGTSMAAPFVAGVLALWVSAQKSLGAKVDHTSACAALAQTCRDAGAPGRDDVYGWGLVDPHRLLNYELRASASGVTVWIPGAKIL